VGAGGYLRQFWGLWLPGQVMTMGFMEPSGW
jgi:hypothetical protein